MTISLVEHLDTQRRAGSAQGETRYPALVAAASLLVGGAVGLVMFGAAAMPGMILVLAAPGLGLLLLDRRLRHATGALLAARRANAVLSQILEKAPLELSIKDAQGRYVWINPEGTRRRALEPDKIAGKTPLEIGIDPLQAASALEHDQTVLRSGLPDGPREQIVYDGEGRIRDITAVTKIPILVDGTVAFIASYNVDHTGRRADQIEADATRRLLATAFQSAPVAMQLVDDLGRIIWANSGFCRHLLPSVESPIGRTLEELVWIPEMLEAVQRANADLLAGRSTQIQLDQLFPATEHRPELQLQVTKVPIFGPPGSPNLVLTMAVDVTELRRAEKDAAIHRRLMDGVLHHAPLSIQVKDADLRFCWANDAFCEAMQKSRDSLLGQTLDELGLPAWAVARTHEVDRQVLATGERTELTERWVQGGRERYVMVVKAPILGDDGRPTHVITLGADVTELQRLQTELADSRRQLQLVLDAVPVVIVLKDRERRYVWVNREYEQRSGRSAADVIGRRAEEFLSAEEFSAEMEQADIELIATGIEPPQVLLHLPARAGHVWAAFRRLPVRGADGTIEGLLMVGVDVTEQIRGAQELQILNEELERRVEERARAASEANELVSTVIVSSPVPIVTHGADGRVSSWNPAASRLTGIAVADARTGDHPTMAVPGLQAIACEILEGQVVEGTELSFIGAEGQSVTCLIYGAPLRGAGGAVVGAVTIWLDVTDRQRSLRELEAMRTSLEDAIEGSDQSIVLYDKDDRIVLYNRHFLDHYSTFRDVLQVGLKFEDGYRLAAERGVFQMPEGQDIDTFLATRLARRARANGERFLRRHADGRVFEVWENRARNGGIVTMGVEVTERLKLEQQLVHAQRMEAVGQLTGGIAHDFNNLLGVISLNLDLILMQVDEGSEIARFASSALDAIAIGATLTRRLIAFARRQTLRPVTTDIQALIRSIDPLLQRAVGQSVTVSYDFAEEALFAVIDPGQLESALVNLAVNARDAMPQGGRLTVSVRRLDVGDGEERAGLAAGLYVEIAVSDTGSGIAPHVLDRVFEPFFSTKETGKGSGLGLSMVFGFVKQSGGHVTIDSELGRFTTVTLYFPQLVDGKPAAPPQGGQTSVDASGHGELILVVEDNAALRQATVDVLVRLGYRVVEAQDSATARDVLADHPDTAMVFVDIVLPNCESGIAFAATLRQQRPDLPLLFTSGFVAPGDEGGETLPADAVVLSKPYLQSELAQALRRCLGRA